MIDSSAVNEHAPPRHFRVFLSSPQDVADERAIAGRVLSRLPYDPFLRSRVTLEIVAWDGPVGNVPMTATLTPQAAIDRGLSRPSECDIVIVILWNRMGTRLPDTYRRVDGTRYLSGTEWEYEDALTAKEPPQILIYRRVDSTRPEDGAASDGLQQREQVERFFLGFRNADGTLRGGVNTYRGIDHFESQLEYHLREILSRLVSVNAGRQGQFVQPSRLDAATPAQATVGRPTTVDVQLCQPASPGSLRDRRQTDPGVAADSMQSSFSNVPIVFHREGDALPPAIVHVDIVAAHHEPVRSTQSILLAASQDSPVVSFSLEPRRSGLSRIHVAVAQDLAGGARVTCGTVILESTISGSRPDDVDQLWCIASRVMGAGTTGGVQGSQPRATLTLRVVEDAERKTVEKYLTLEVSQLCQLLTATEITPGISVMHSPENRLLGTDDKLKRITPAVQTLLAGDSELVAFLEEHPDISAVDLVLLVEARVAAAWPMYSARVIGAIVVKTGLLAFINQRSSTGAHPQIGP